MSKRKITYKLYGIYGYRKTVWYEFNGKPVGEVYWRPNKLLIAYYKLMGKFFSKAKYQKKIDNVKSILFGLALEEKCLPNPNSPTGHTKVLIPSGF